MKKILLIGAAVVLVLVALLLVINLWVVPSAVSVAQVEQREVVQTLVSTGQVVPAQSVVISSEVSGRVVDVAVEEGDGIEEGQVVVWLDEEEARLAVDQAAAMVEEARARLDAVADRGAPVALQDLNQASMALQAAEEEYERAQRLFDEGLITGAEVDERRRQVEQARAQVESARAVYRETAADGSAHDEAAAMLERAMVEYEVARSRLRKYRIRAPKKGTVLAVEVQEGMTIQPGRSLLHVAAEGPVEIRIEPDERELANLERGQPAIAVADAYSQMPFSAEVRRIDPIVDPERGTIIARLLVDDPPRFLRAQMTVTTEVELDRRQDALVVPRVAVREADSSQPWVLKLEGGRATPVDVEVGLEDARYVEITRGLTVGEEVVADADIEPGDRVRRGDEYEVLEEVEEVDESPAIPLPIEARVGEVGR